MVEKVENDELIPIEDVEADRVSRIADVIFQA